MDKVCPVVRRADGTVLAFRHPLAGLQFVKGTVEPGEDIRSAATRELHEESGLTLTPQSDLGFSDAIIPGDTWHFWLMASADHLDTWDHACADDGGHIFSFFWQDLTPPLPDAFAASFQRAAAHMRKAFA